MRKIFNLNLWPSEEDRFMIFLSHCHMRKIFNLNLWPSEEEKRRKQLYNQQQRQSTFPPTTGGGVVVDGVDGGEGGVRRLFGIRNYLHNFYFMSPSPTVEEIGVITGSPSGGNWYLLPPPPSHRLGLYACRLMTLLGMFLLLGGAAAIIVGYSWPHYFRNNTLEERLLRIAIDQDEEGNFYIPPERLADMLRDPMHGVKMAGFCVFAIGASMMAVSLMIPSFAQCFGGPTSRLAAFASGDNTPNEAPVRVYSAGQGAQQKFRVLPAKPTGGHKISPTSGPVPVMEEMCKVQPIKGGKSPSPPAYSPSGDDLLTGGGKEPLIGRQ
jgi:hypothetical protein